MDIQALKTEFETDPSGLGYAQATNQGKLDLINEPRGAYLFPVLVDKGPFLQKVAACHFRIPQIAQVKQQSWWEMLATIRSITSIDVLSSEIQGMLAMALADGVLVQNEVDTLNDMAVRLGSRAEHLFGVGSVVTMNDLALTL